MKFETKKLWKYCLIILIGILVFLPYKFIFSEAEETTSEYLLSAVLYDTNQYSSGAGTELTEAGAEVTDWQFETSKYLQINPQVPADGNTYVVTVRLPQEFYIVATDLSAPAGYQDFEFTKNESLSVNTDSTYDLKTYSGTVEYTMNYMGTSGTIQLEIRYDTVLWDKQAGSTLTPDAIEPIAVILSQKDSEGNITDLKKVSISKATAGEALGYSQNVDKTVDGISYGSAAITISSDKEIYLSASFSSSVYSYNMYFPKLEITVNLPYFTDEDGNKYFLTIDTDSISFPKLTNPLYEIDSTKMSTEGILTINLENAYFSPGSFFKCKAGPLNEELQDLEQNSFLFSGGKIKVIAECKNGSTEIGIFSQGITNITYQKETLENVSVSVGSKGVTIIERPEQAVSELGGFYLGNTGTGDSCAKTIWIEFDTEDTKLIKVTTINTGADTIQQYIDITYTLVDDDGNRVYMDSDGNLVDSTDENAIGEWTYSLNNSYYNSTSTANLRNKLTRSMLPEAHREYYFKSIKYTLEKIESGARLYAYQATASLTGSGNFFGYINENAIAGQTVKSSITVTSENIDIATIKKTATTTLQSTSNPTYMINNIKMDKTTIEAGESLTVSGRIAGVNYPYGNSMWIKGIRLGVILPKDVSVNEQSITTNKNTSVEDIEVTSQELEDGNVLWIIKFPEDICIGYATESLGQLSSGTYINFTMQLDTAFTMNASTLFAKDLFIATGYKQTNSAGGSYSYAKKTDTYDLNENGSTTDIIAGVSATDTTSCQVVAQTATLEINDSITIDRNGSITTEANEQSLLSKDDIVNYNYDISCLSGGSADGFYFYIPIPKTISNIDDFLIKESENGFFDLGMTGAVLVTGSDIYTYKYSFEQGVSYENISEIANWYTAEDIENDDTLNWEDITLIKLELKGDSIQNGDSTRITIKLKYCGDLYAADAGMKNIWQSGGYYQYINNGRELSGNFTTTGVSVDLKYTQELEEITLTAAKDMSPQVDGNVNTKTVEKSTFSEFKNAHTFSIVSVDTYNVVLQTKEYILANENMAGIDANKTFAITVSMDGATEYDILSDVQDNPIQIGSSQENSSPEFIFNIYNADSISENSQIRYILVTLESDNGVTMKQKININREITKASDPQSAIIAGKSYVAFDDTTSEVTISQDSAFTAQYVINYIPDTYSEQKIIFSNSLPIGTNITFVNLSDEDNPTYWYYKMNTEETIINLAEITCMGTLQTKNYTIPTGADPIEEKFLIIVDFSRL